MAEIDPELATLLFLAEKDYEELIRTDAPPFPGLVLLDSEPPRVRLAVDHDPEVPSSVIFSDAEKFGFAIRSASTGVLAGDIELGRVLDYTKNASGLRQVELASRVALELDVSVPAIWGTALAGTAPNAGGSDVLIGIIDTGIDWRHPCFCHPDNTSRIENIWDQTLVAEPNDTVPVAGYGVEYSKQQIDRALASGPNDPSIRHVDHDWNGHGTHVAGIAAGNGLAYDDVTAPGRFVGVAPEAHLAVVAIRPFPVSDTNDIQYGVAHILDVAERLGMPCVINISAGDHKGAHDGSSLLERYLAGVVTEKPGRVVVKSAGNHGARPVHATGVVPQDGIVDMFLRLPSSWPAVRETIGIWYELGDVFTVSVTSPTGESLPPMPPGPESGTYLTLTTGNEVLISSVVNEPTSSKNRIFVTLLKSQQGGLDPGTWRITLHGRQSSNGRFNAWIQTGSVGSFLGPTLSAASTVTIPGTSDGVITAGSYITKSSVSALGELSTFSSSGPTIDGREAPTLVAPGEAIVSCRARGDTASQYRSLSGTSMAAPHVTGAAALLLEAWRDAPFQTIKDCLVNSASQAGVPAGAYAWGAGRLDIQAALELLAQQRSRSA